MYGPAGSTQNDTTRQHVGNPRHSWYDDACRQARHNFICTQKKYGGKHTLTSHAYKHYRQTTQRAKRASQSKYANEMMNDLHHHPKHFWTRYKTSRRMSNPFNMQQWTTYFSKLFNPPVSQDRNQHLNHPYHTHCHII